MCCGVLKAAGGLGAIVALILVVVALLKQIILLLGFLLTAIKVAIVVVFVALLVMIVRAWKSRPTPALADGIRLPRGADLERFRDQAREDTQL